MKKLLLVIAMEVALANSAFAEQPTITVSCANITPDACETMVAALKRAPYIGPIRPAEEPMACARVVSYGPSPVVWVNGTKDTYRHAPVIEDTGVVYIEPFGLNRQWTVTESCIPLRLLNSVSNLTLCTGLGEDGYHWSLTSKELALMKKTGHFTSYTPFLEVSDRESLSVERVRALYSARYGAHY